MGLILDSSLLIAGEKEKFDLAGFLATRDEPVAMAAITASELLHGLSLGYTLATLNLKEFARVRGLMLVEESVLLAFQKA